MKSGRINKIFKKNILLISVFVLIFSLVSGGIYISRSTIEHSEKISMLEIEEMSKSETAFNQMFLQMAESANYLSTINFCIDTDKFINNWSQIYTVQKQMDMMIATFTAIEGIKVVDRITGYSLDVGNAKTVPTLGKHYTTISNVKLFQNTNPELPELFMVLEKTEGIYSCNSVYIAISSEYLLEYILQNNSEKREEYIIDKNGNILIASDVSDINRSIYELYDFKDNLFDGDISLEKINGEQKYIQSHEMKQHGFYIVSIADADIYSEYTRTNNINVMLLIGLLAICAVIIVFLIFKVTYQPIKEILYQVGDMAFIESKSLSEVQYISHNLRQLKSHNNELSDLVDEKVEELTIQHIGALQAQICPHFTYNTLDAINWIAYRTLKKRDNDISKVITNMSLLYKSSMNINEIFRTVKEEIEFSDCYLEILYIRMRDVFTVTWDVDESLYDYSILKLSIQPLIENVANHAIGEGHEKVNISISIKEFGEYIKVTISDNGIGIKEEELRRIRANINDFSGSSSNLGLKNVNERLQLLYGEEAALNMTSVYGEGTVCTFMYPKTEKNIQKTDAE